MAVTYNTPGVYVEEISTLPPSVAEVPTAIPAFCGYTKKTDLKLPTRIEAMLDYERLFGGPPEVLTGVTVKSSGPTTTDFDITVDAPKSVPPLLYYSLRMYFDNGGGPCYIVSLGGYDSNSVSLTDFKSGLDALKRVDEPTLIVMPDATRLGADDFVKACAAAVDHCGEMTDRFAILDVQPEQDAVKQVDDFRKLSSNYLSYGAAYTPYLETSLVYSYIEANVKVVGLPAATFGGITIVYSGKADAPTAEILGGDTSGDTKITATDSPNPKLTITLNAKDRSASEVMTAWASLSDNGKKGFQIEKKDDGVRVAVTAAMTLAAPSFGLEALKTSNTALYNSTKTALAKQRVTLPPSGAIAGIYASVDRDRGVWKAPANVAVASVIDLTQMFTDAEQGGLNIDSTSGKSINVIRSFTGRGILVWGARTLAGNDNEWRYIPVRRLFITIEESTKKATAFAVFEPNDSTTWLKVKAMIESYLYGLWERGALAGAKPEDAYFVNVGLGATMTTQDILEGRMIVEIGVAAVRPAEFIILRFTHKLQVA
jgi:uncharacterized protein